MVAGVDPGERLPRKGELPAHEKHQTEAEEEEGKAAPQILDADDLVIGGENVAPPKAELVMIVGVVVMRRVAMRRCGVRRSGGGFPRAPKWRRAGVGSGVEATA